jgi:hypothetical protein
MLGVSSRHPPPQPPEGTMRRALLAVFALIGLSSGYALASARAPETPSSRPYCSQYATSSTCNADPRCMWYGPYCGQRLE